MEANIIFFSFYFFSTVSIGKEGAGVNHPVCMLRYKNTNREKFDYVKN